MSVRITFLQEMEPTPEGGEVAQVLAPREAVRTEGGYLFAWVVTEGRLRRQPVETAGERGGNTIVSKGLAGGEALVLGPADGLREGQRVETLRPR